MAAQLAPAEIDVVMERALTELPAPTWRVTDTRRSSPQGLRADFVVAGPPGVFVISCARPQEKPRARAKLAAGLLDAAEATAQLTGVRRDEVHPVLCLTSDAAVDGWSRGVTVCAVANLVDTLTLRRDLLTPAEVDSAAQLVWRAMRAGGKHRA